MKMESHIAMQSNEIEELKNKCSSMVDMESHIAMQAEKKIEELKKKYESAVNTSFESCFY